MCTDRQSGCDNPVSYHPSESEWITAGSFRLLTVEPLGRGGVKIRVEQTGVFKEK